MGRDFVLPADFQPAAPGGHGDTSNALPPPGVTT
jgi:hypothetical protein